jgi:hypothetical protein
MWKPDGHNYLFHLLSGIAAALLQAFLLPRATSYGGYSGGRGCAGVHAAPQARVVSLGTHLFIYNGRASSVIFLLLWFGSIASGV